MGWKRFEKEFRKTGKSIENEVKRVSEKTTDEVSRLAERLINSAASQPSENNDLPITQQKESVANVPHEEINYNPEGFKPGRAYIINHLTFNNNNLKRRTGSEADVERLRKIFRQFGMKVKWIDDATMADVRDLMEKISLYDFRNLACLVIVVMSHGHESSIIAAQDGEYSLDYDIMYPILRNGSLTSKLKLLITQACKGPVNPLLEIEGPRARPTAIPSEILQVNSCVEGYVSYLHPQLGSPFITTLCDHLERSGLSNGILDIANAVVEDVKKKFFDIQIPMIHTNLTRKFVFGHYVKDDIALEDKDDASSD